MPKPDRLGANSSGAQSACVTWGKGLIFWESQFPHLRKETNNSNLGAGAEGGGGQEAGHSLGQKLTRKSPVPIPNSKVSSGFGGYGFR